MFSWSVVDWVELFLKTNATWLPSELIATITITVAIVTIIACALIVIFTPVIVIGLLTLILQGVGECIGVICDLVKKRQK